MHRAAQREHAGAATNERRRQSDSDAAEAHPLLTDPKLRKGRPPGNDWRNKPVDERHGKEIEHGGTESAAKGSRGHG